MKEDIEFLGSNIKSDYALIWQIGPYRMCLWRQMFGGIYVKVFDEQEKEIILWPSLYHKGFMLMQFNYLAHNLLNGDSDKIPRIKYKYFKSNTEDEDLNDKEVRKRLVQEMWDWQNEVFGGVLNEWDNNYKYIPDFNEVEMEETWHKIKEDYKTNRMEKDMQGTFFTCSDKKIVESAEKTRKRVNKTLK